MRQSVDHSVYDHVANTIGDRNNSTTGPRGTEIRAEHGKIKQQGTAAIPQKVAYSGTKKKKAGCEGRNMEGRILGASGEGWNLEERVGIAS